MKFPVKYNKQNFEERNMYKEASRKVIIDICIT